MNLYPSDDPIFLKVAKMLSDMCGVPIDQIQPSDKLFSYAKDSLDVVEIVMKIEDEFETNISDNDLPRIETVADLVEIFRKRGD
jgi:acyl carrier protein